MPRTRLPEKRTAPHVSLYLGNSLPSARESVLLPWFQSAGAASSGRSEPTLVVIPFRTHEYAIKEWLLARGLSLLGLRFVTPAQLRELLGTRTRMHLALREHLRLLLASAAEECMDLPNDPVLREERMLQDDFLAAKSVKRAPDHLLRTIDQLGAAGWDFSAIGLPALQKVVTRFHRQLDRCGFELIHVADRRALEDAEKSSPIFASVLVSGFNGAHWPLWPLLHAAVLSAKQATVLLDDPRDLARDLDEAWVGTWEEAFGEAKAVTSSVTLTSNSLFSEEEMRGVPSQTGSVHRSFLVGADTTEQAKAVAQQCLQFLSEPKCDSVGIVFAEPGALPRLVGQALVRSGVPHYDSLAHPLPGPFETSDWHAWLELQQSPRLNALLHFMTVLSNREKVFPDLRLSAFERTLRSAYAEVLLDDLDVLQRFCAQTPSNETKKNAGTILDSIHLLPPRARFTQFLRETKTACEQLDWKPRWMAISEHAGDWAGQLDGEISRGLYLRWLGEIVVTFSVSRPPEGDHPYARVQLVTVPQAHAHEWSHLIFAGWNEGSWPRPERGEFARQDEIDAFNRSIRKMNCRVTREGRQGEGHTAVLKNHTFYLGPVEQNQIELGQFEALYESVSQKVAFTASLVKDDAPERLWNPGELFTRHYQEAQQRPLTQAAMNQLHLQTRAWLETSGKSGAKPPEATGPTRTAYDARRDLDMRSGEFDFAFRATPPVTPVLSVSQFEQLLSAPALVWLNKYLGVKAAEENGNVWNTSSGKWVHDWLAAMATGTEKNFVSFPNTSEIEKRVCAAADSKRSEVEKLCQAAGKPLPDWWTGGWRNALFLARALADKLSEVTDWPWMATEWTIEGDFAIAADTDARLSLRGRIDLLLSRAAPPRDSLASEEIWIIDYKTGAKKALFAGAPNAEGNHPALKKKLLDGSALQLGLYSLAAGALGAGQTTVSILSPLVRPLRQQISGSDFAGENEIFAALAKMQQTGVFGMHGTLRSPYRFTDDYPLATLAIDPDILEQRWELTHPALVRDEEEIFW